MMIRVFPKRTKWTPIDDLVFIGDPPLFRPKDSKIPVYISCTFTWDKQECERLSRSWLRFYSNVKIGGPAFSDSGSEFIPGRFIKSGVTITSRGCPKKCLWCFVPKREGKIREYPIEDGHILQDNNILACSRPHQQSVFEMLQRQKKPINFAGGLDPEYLNSWHIQQFGNLKIKQFFFSCDYPGAEKYLEKVVDLTSNYPTWKKRCYVLIGFNGEDIIQAEKRLNHVYEMGFLPFAQLYQNENKRSWTPGWDKLHRKWCRPAAYRTKGL